MKYHFHLQMGEQCDMESPLLQDPVVVPGAGAADVTFVVDGWLYNLIVEHHAHRDDDRAEAEFLAAENAEFAAGMAYVGRVGWRAALAES